MVLVTSANGRVGRLVINELVKRGFEIRGLDINPKAESLTDIGVKEVLIGDASDPKVIHEAMQGIEQVVYVPPMMTYIEDEMANLATDEAIASGVKQFIQMSVCHPQLSTLRQHVRKLRAEEHLTYEGLKNEFNYTILQPLHYTHNVIIPEMVRTHEYPNWKPLDKKLGYVDGIDVAEVTGKILEEGDKHKYATYELCGDIHLSIREIGEMFEKISGLPLHTYWVPREDFFKVFPNFVGVGSDSYSRRAVLAMRDTYNTWGFDANCNTLEWLLGRKSTSMEEYMRRELKKCGVTPQA